MKPRRRHRGAYAAAWLLAGWLACVAMPAWAERKVFLAGDSTVAEYGPDRDPQRGWGQAFAPYLVDGWSVRNHAIGGRSSRSFIDQGRLDAIAREIGPGDVLLIQFGHNDAKREDPARYTDPETDYPRFLKAYIDLARSKGATPVLVTSLARRVYDFRSLVDTHGPYPPAMKALAAREQVALIDLEALSAAWIRQHGEEGSKAYFMFVPEQGKADGTHLNHAGARAVACLVAHGWRNVDAEAPVRPVALAECNALPGRPPARASGSVVVNERSIAVEQPGPHEGAGTTTAYPFFDDASGFALAFRKRAMHPGSTIGEHVNDKDEIYYVLSGRGELTLNGRRREVGPGDAVLTRSGDSHALAQRGRQDLVIIVTYPRPGQP